MSVGNLSPMRRASDQRVVEGSLALHPQFGSTFSLLDLAADNLSKRKILKDTGKLWPSQFLPVTDLLKELTRDGID